MISGGRGGRPRILALVPAVALLGLMVTTGCATRAAPPSPPPSPPPGRPLFGITVDDVGDPARLARSMQALPERPTVRIYFDSHEPAVYYQAAARSFARVGAVMGEVLDSSDETGISVAALASRWRQYLDLLGTYVSIWEVGNEVNGDWLGPYPVVAAKLAEAYRLVAARHERTALTLYANEFGPDNCGDGASELTPEQFSERYVPAYVRDGLDLVLLSYYPDECGGLEPGGPAVRAELVRLHSLYPRASLGFGEVGLARPVTAADISRGRQVLEWAYSLDPGLPYYVGGYFWWYAAEDALGRRAPLASVLADGFRHERAALGSA